MRTRRALILGLFVATALLAPRIVAAQQEAALSGTITDSTGGVLPGVTVTATHQETGNTFQAVTDGGGRYRIPLRVGHYKIVAELSGFQTVSRDGLEILLGQQPVVNLQMQAGGVQETVTVTGEAGLVDVSQTRVSGNIDPRQMQELPVNGRNWQNLALLAPGARANAIGDLPTTGSGSVNDFQINMDGQQVKMNISLGDTFGQPEFSKDSIAEFEFVSNRFDASQGRSAGVQVNAITKSGTNTPSGLFSGYFRDSKFIAEDFIQHRVLPYSDQQLSGTYGGPIVKDRIHYFANWEFERTPQTFAYSSVFPRFNVDQAATQNQNKGGLRLDAQFSSHTRLAIRANSYRSSDPADSSSQGSSATQHPTGLFGIRRHSDEYLGTLTEVLTNRTVNQIKVGYAGYGWAFTPYSPWLQGPRAAQGVITGAPVITLTGYRFGPTNNINPQKEGQDQYSVRDDLTTSYTLAGHHDLKVGGEYMFLNTHLFSCNNCDGTLTATGGPIPANIQDLFPVWNDVSTWNLNALAKITRTYSVTVGNLYAQLNRPIYAAWAQDDWLIKSHLTIDLGVRYDVTIGVFGNNSSAPIYAPFLTSKPPNDFKDVAPRLGFAYQLNDRTVIRGGGGKFFADIGTGTSHAAMLGYQSANLTVNNDGRADFPSNPFNGPIPTFDQTIAKGLVRDLRGVPAPVMTTPYSYQTSIGVQRQLSASSSINVDYVFLGGRNENTSYNINLGYNPVTGVNYPNTDASHRPVPTWGTIPMPSQDGRSNLNSLSATLTKRMSHNWQLSGTYTLSALKDATATPIVITSVNPIVVSAVDVSKLPLDLRPQYTYSVGDQRHRAVVNGIWQMPYGFQLSGLYFFGSGQRYATTYGGTPRLTGDGRDGSVRPDGTIVPRNNFVGLPIHRVDVRLQRRFKFTSRIAADGLAEVFNVFNHANYGAYTTQESSASYGLPAQNNNIAYQPRVVQLGFRFTF